MNRRPTLAPDVLAALEALRAHGYGYHGPVRRRLGLQLLISAPPRPGEPRAVEYRSQEEVLALAQRLGARGVCPMCDGASAGWALLCAGCEIEQAAADDLDREMIEAELLEMKGGGR